MNKYNKPIDEERRNQLAEMYDRGFEHGQQSKYNEIASRYLILSYEDVQNIKRDAVMEFMRDMCICLANDAMYTQAQIFAVAENLINGSR